MGRWCKPSQPPCELSAAWVKVEVEQFQDSHGAPGLAWYAEPVLSQSCLCILVYLDYRCTMGPWCTSIMYDVWFHDAEWCPVCGTEVSPQLQSSTCQWRWSSSFAPSEGQSRQSECQKPRPGCQMSSEPHGNGMEPDTERYQGPGNTVEVPGGGAHWAVFRTPDVRQEVTKAWDFHLDCGR